MKDIEISELIEFLSEYNQDYYRINISNDRTELAICERDTGVIIDEIRLDK